MPLQVYDHRGSPSLRSELSEASSMSAAAGHSPPPLAPHHWGGGSAAAAGSHSRPKSPEGLGYSPGGNYYSPSGSHSPGAYSPGSGYSPGGSYSPGGGYGLYGSGFDGDEGPAGLRKTSKLKMLGHKVRGGSWWLGCWGGSYHGGRPDACLQVHPMQGAASCCRACTSWNRISSRGHS